MKKVERSEIEAALNHFENLLRLPKVTIREIRLWHNYVRLSGRKAKVMVDGFPMFRSANAMWRATDCYVAIAQDLRRQCLEQLAKRQKLQQGDLFE